MSCNACEMTDLTTGAHLASFVGASTPLSPAMKQPAADLTSEHAGAVPALMVPQMMVVSCKDQGLKL